MSKLQNKVIMFAFLLISLLSLKTVTASATVMYPITLQYSAHVQNIGWQGWVSNDAIAGTVGQGLRLEAIKIQMVNPPAGLRVKYRVHVQNIGWQGWVYDGSIAGTVGQGLRVEAIQIMLEGPSASKYHVFYQAQIQNIGWQGWACDGAVAGTIGQALRLETLKADIRSADWRVRESNYIDSRGANYGVSITYSHLYFRDKLAAIRFADSLTVSNSEAAFEAGLSLALSYVPGTFGGLGAAATAFYWCDSATRNNLASSIKNAAYSTTNGYVHVETVYTQTPSLSQGGVIAVDSWNGSTEYTVPADAKYTNTNYTY